MKLIIISAMTQQGIIGNKSGLPWHIPEEYRRFLDRIRHNTVIIGRRSFDIFGGDLTSRHTIVLSRKVNHIQKVIICNSVTEALREARFLGLPVYCAGGSQIYAQLLPFADKMVLSYIKGDFTGDSYFPKYNRSEWEIESIDDQPQFEQVIYRRKSGKRPLE